MQLLQVVPRCCMSRMATMRRLRIAQVCIASRHSQHPKHHVEYCAGNPDARTKRERARNGQHSCGGELVPPLLYFAFQLGVSKQLHIIPPPAPQGQFASFLCSLVCSFLIFHPRSPHGDGERQSYFQKTGCRSEKI